MRTLLTLCVLLFTLIIGNAQKTTTTTTFINDGYNQVFIELPDFREIKSGSKFIVNYEGDWPAEMEGAFEYAIKIWEEVLPMTLPINITARITVPRDNRVLSQVRSFSDEYTMYPVNGFASPHSMVKSVSLRQYHSGRHDRFFYEITDTTIFQRDDIDITYNSMHLNEFDFSIDGERDSSKYDFVTFALRDIAIGLGFSTNITANTSLEEFDITEKRNTPFEEAIFQALGTYDPHQAYVKSTQGSVDLGVQSLKLYAPREWDNYSSLRYFMPETHPLSKLLCYDFKKGYVMRNLNGPDWDDLFGKILEWREDIGVGTESFNTTSEEGNTQNLLPYKGSYTLFFPQDKQKITTSTFESYSEDPLSDSNLISENDIRYYCQKYDLLSPNGVGSGTDHISISALKKDGSWDCLWISHYDYDPITINIEDLQLHFPESTYARSISGGLRYRITYCKEKIQGWAGPYHSYKTKYFTRDFTPQQPKIKYTPSLSTSDNRQGVTLHNLSDDYYIGCSVRRTQISPHF